MIPFTIKSLDLEDREGVHLRLSAHLGQRKRYEALFMAAGSVLDGRVDGDFAEFGVYGGETATILAAAINYYECQGVFEKYRQAAGLPQKLLHLFDSFRGYPEFDTEEDRGSFEFKSGMFRPGGHGNRMEPPDFEKAATTGSRSILGADRLRIYNGYFSDTLQAQFDPNTKLALVHVDCDLYQSSAEVLDFIFKNDMMSNGAILLMDGFLTNHSSNKFGMRKAWREVNEKYNIDAENCGEVAPGCWKFYIHTDERD